MIGAGWNNGSANEQTGSGYGIRISPEDRDKHFRSEWKSITLQLEGGTTVEITLSQSFWGDCCELRSFVIGRWLLDQGLAPWPRRRPPKVRLERSGNGKFRLSQ